MLIVYIMHMECVDIMMNHHLLLHVTKVTSLIQLVDF